jgi:Flp pilus assembly protein TadD
MFRLFALLVFLVFSACTGGEPMGGEQGSVAKEQAPAAQEQPAAEAPGGPAVPPDEQMVNCLNRFREKKYDEAVTTCRKALESNPGDPQILKAIELSEEALKEKGGA